MKFEFKTEKGANINFEIEVKHITEETVDSDGYKFTTKCDRFSYNIISLTANGKKIDFPTYNDNRITFEQIINGTKRNCAIMLPAQIAAEIKTEEKNWFENVIKPKNERIAAQEQKYEVNHNKVIKTMNCD